MSKKKCPARKRPEGLEGLNIQIKAGSRAELHWFARKAGFSTLTAWAKHTLSKASGVDLGESWTAGFRGKKK